jgi:beta-mannosidase
MLGLDPALGRGELFGELLPALVAEAGVDAVYVPSAPTGGDQPFRTNRGLVDYFGVGAYLRPLEDARRAAVPFASECLAFANVPDDTPRDRAEGVMRDVGADWDFADVRDHYLRLLHGVGPADEDYWERGRFVTGEVMAEVLGEWRRTGSPTGGGIVLWSRDLAPGAGWGVLDHRGAPKAAWHHLRRALAPLAVWTTDEGLNGIDVHAANDGPAPVEALLRVALYRNDANVGEASERVTLEPRSGLRRSVESMLGRFVDVSYAYRFGEPQQDLVVATLEDGDTILAQAFRLPVGPPRERRSADDLGLSVAARRRGDDVEVRVRSHGFLHGARLGGCADPADDAFSVEPGHERTVRARIVDDTIVVRALNLTEPLQVVVE